MASNIPPLRRLIARSRSISSESSQSRSSPKKIGSTVLFDGYLQYLDGTDTKMYVRGAMTKNNGELMQGSWVSLGEDKLIILND